MVAAQDYAPTSSAQQQCQVSIASSAPVATGTAGLLNSAPDVTIYLRTEAGVPVTVESNQIILQERTQVEMYEA